MIPNSFYQPVKDIEKKFLEFFNSVFWKKFFRKMRINFFENKNNSHLFLLF